MHRTVRNYGLYRCICLYCRSRYRKTTKGFEKKFDEYNGILLKIIADRLAEALTEYMHEKVRKDIWGYSNKEKFNNQQLIDEQYIGIRPALAALPVQIILKS